MKLGSLLLILLFTLVLVFGADAPKEGDAAAGPVKSLFEQYKDKLKKEMVPTWKRLMRLPYKTCSNWQEIQRGQTDFISTKMQCLTKCYLDDYCTGTMIIIGQERGCRYLSGTCYILESYDWEYFQKFVPFSSNPYMLGVDDRSVRFKFSQLAWSQARCWIYLIINNDKEKNYNLIPNTDRPFTTPGDSMIGFIVNAYAVTTLMNVKDGPFFFTNLSPETEYQVHCANAAGAKSSPLSFKTAAWPLDRVRRAKQGCIDGQAESELMGRFMKVGLSFCLEMCTRRKCFSFMYGRPDSEHAGTCYLTMSCGERISTTMPEWNLYTLRNLDYDVIKSNAKCTPAIGSPDNPIIMPPIKLLGTQLLNPISCRKRCYDNPGCEFFIFGKQGSQKGSCFQVNSDCQTFEPNIKFDVWRLTRQPFHWWKMNAECIGGNLYIGDALTFDDCRNACKKKVNCNYFTRADIDAGDHGVCLGAVSCDKTRSSYGFFVYQIVVPPPLEIEDIEREGPKKIDRLGNPVGGGDKGGGAAPAAEAPAKEERRRRLLEMSYGAGLGQEFEPRLKIPMLPPGHHVEHPMDEGYMNALFQVILALPLTEKFLYFVWPLVFGAFCGLLVERYNTSL